MVEITCVVDARAELGEGTLWDPEARRPLVDRHLGSADPPLRPGDRPRRDLGGAGIPRLPRPARAAAASSSPWRAASTSSTPRPARFEPIVDPEADLPTTRFNDGKPDRQGRFWSGTMFEVPGKPIEFVGSL